MAGNAETTHFYGPDEAAVLGGPAESAKAPPMLLKVDQEWEGLPYRGPALTLRETDGDEYKPTPMRAVTARQLDSTCPEDLAQYEEVLRKTGKQTAVILVEERQFDEKLAGWRILLVWA